MLYLNQDLQDLCKKNEIEADLLQDLIKAEKSNLSSNRGASYKAVLENVIKSYL